MSSVFDTTASTSGDTISDLTDFDKRVIETINKWMREPLNLPAELRGWLPRFLETTDFQLPLGNVISGVQAAVPVGAILPFGGAIAPDFYLIADGSNVSRATYAPLFHVYGTAYGVGDGSTTFGLPNLAARFLIGRSGADTAIDTVGETGGSTTIATGNLPVHAHTINSDGSHQHTGGSGFSFVVNTGSGGTIALTGGTSAVVEASNFAGSHSHGGTTNNAGSGTAYRPPFFVVNYIIRAL